MRPFRISRCLLLQPRPARVSLLVHRVILSSSSCRLRRRWRRCRLSRRSVTLMVGQACVSLWYSLLSLICWRTPRPWRRGLLCVSMLLLNPAEGWGLCTISCTCWVLWNRSLRAVVTWEICSWILRRRLCFVPITTTRSSSTCRCISFNHPSKLLLRRIELLVC